MWERFELFWTAFEKFALFFSFVATLTILVMMVLIYDAVTDIQMPPTLSAQDIDPLYDIVADALEQIQDAVLTTEVSIDHTVPVTFEVRLDPAETELKFVGTNKINAGEITIELRDNAGRFVGEKATIEIGAKNALKVKMDVTESVTIDVPVQVSIPVRIPLSSVDLQSVIERLHEANVTMHLATTTVPQSAAEVAQP